MKIPNYRRITLPRKRLRAERNIKTIHTASLVLLVLCFSMIPNLCCGESWMSLHPGDAFVSTPTEKELIQTDDEIVQNFAMANTEAAGEETGAEQVPDPNLCFGESWESLHPGEAFVSTPSENELIQEDKEIVQNFAIAPSEPAEEETAAEEIPDPLQSMNRAFFKFNDKLYFWVLKPIATGYKAVLPEDLRIGVRNFFSNLATPIRLANCMLQLRLKAAGNETVRFLLNTTLGLGGFLDPARKELKIEKSEADFGQTLGTWGMGPSFYVNWPILGPSSLRDTIGFVGDLALDPRTYVFDAPWNYVFGAARPLDAINNTSFTIGEYEDLKKAAIDPYLAVRNAYFQYREHKIRNR